MGSNIPNALQREILKPPFKVALPNEEQQLISTEWTDLISPPHTLPGALFLFEHLVILRQRLDCLLEKDVKQAILTVDEPELDRSGGSYVDQRSPGPLGSQMSPEQQARIIAILVEMLLRQWNEETEVRHDPA